MSRYHRRTVCIFTHSVTAIIASALSIVLVSLYVHCILLKKEKDKHLEFLKEDGQVFVGVVLPSKTLHGSSEDSRKRARAFLTDKEDNLWQYMRTEHEPLGFKYQVFIFEAIPSRERMVVAK